MITIVVSDKQLTQQAADAYLIFVPEDFTAADLAQTTPLGVDGVAIVQQSNFTGKAHSLLAVPLLQNNKLTTIYCVGLGSQKKKIAVEQYRRALGKVIKTIRGKYATIAMSLPDEKLFDTTPAYLAEQTALITDMAYYHFDKFLTQKEPQKDCTLTLAVQPAQRDTMKAAVARGNIVGEAVNKVRFWIDMPPSQLTPTELADRAQEVAKTYGLKCTVFSEKDIQKMGMGGLAGVSAGSDQDCKFAILEYRTDKKNAPTLAYVGKGITFDSGGLSLKPAKSMETMKDDMSGAAAVLGTMQVLAQLKPDVNVIGLMPLSENLPGGSATKPGDILTFYNGKTAEILNTDAEGRLVLADALAYAAEKYKPDAMVDLATLTGACLVALGHYYTALMSDDEALVTALQSAADVSGERVWRLPLDDDFKAANKTPYADVSNCGSARYRAGTITAGLFLQNFVGDTPWAHLDIAGTSFDVPDISYYNPGATGAGVRLLVELAMNWGK